ncbi:uncharacterized protein LOC125651267 [Ostrea edulis]|uniref:uncharacterized protein LOC125651267 n=1 Tax=Ostrea edulis TaxID=37623 RepID=UPI0024AF01AB|nr:uncharacterized protein LOC125651267 [Ostrea edulis]
MGEKIRESREQSAVPLLLNVRFYLSGLNCSKCVDFRNVRVLKNTVPGFDLGTVPKLPSNPKCESAVNGLPVDGVELITCPENSLPYDAKVYRCVAYSGQLIWSSVVNFGSSSGEVEVSIDGTYRSCLLQNVEASNSCENQNSELPSDDPFRGVALKGVPVAVNSTIFKGKKCVSDEAGRFPLNGKDNGNGAIALKLNLSVFFSFLSLTYFM